MAMELWTPQHTRTLLPALAVMLLIGIVLRLTMGGKSFKVRMIPIQVIAVILVLLEVGKQAVSFFRGYDLYHIPLHFCSLFIFAMPAMAFYRGKHQKQVFGVTSALCGSVFLLMLIYPNLIYGPWNVEGFFKDYLDFHTVAFHNLVMLAFVLIVALNLHTPGAKGENKAVVLFMLGFCAVSATMAQILKTNFANFYQCNIPPLEQVRLSLAGIIGAVPTQLLYILIVSALNVFFVLGVYRLYCLLAKLLAIPEKQTV
jgi:hypothetical protein